MNSSDVATILNPYTPLLYLPPPVAETYTIATYINLCTTGFMGWDWVMSMPNEYTFLLMGRLSISKVIYVWARIFTLAACLCSCIFYVAPIDDCQAVGKTLSVLMVLALSINNLLFLFRVRAVYGNSKGATFFFGFCYLVVFVTLWFVPSSLMAIRIEPTKFCLNAEIKPIRAALAVVFNAVNDTLVFIAISYRITSQSMSGVGWRSMWRRFIYGDGVSRVAKELLQNGQLSYLATISVSIAQVIMGFIKQSKTNATLLTITVIALENVMICRVHRAVVLRLLADADCQNGPFVLSTIISNIQAETKTRLEYRERPQLESTCDVA